MSCDGNVLNSGSRPARPSSFPPTRLHSVPALDFPDKSTLLYLMSSKSTFYYSPTLQIVTLTCMHFFQKVFKSKGQRMSNSACDQSIIAGQSVTCRTFSRFPTLHLRGAQHYFLLAILQSCNPPHFSTIGGSLFWRLKFTKFNPT